MKKIKRELRKRNRLTRKYLNDFIKKLNDNKAHKLGNIKKEMKHKAEANRKPQKKNKAKRTGVAKRHAIEWPCPITYALHRMTEITACRSMLWCSTQIPNCKHRVNSQTRGNKFYGEPHRLHGITVLNCFISLSIYLFYLAISIYLIYLFWRSRCLRLHRRSRSSYWEMETELRKRSAPSQYSVS